MKKKIIIILIVYILGFVTPIIYRNAKKDILENQVIYTITVDREFINMRPEVNLSSDVIRKVYKGEQFKVIKYYEGNSYNWYNVIYDDGQTGWIADTKENDWIIIENNCK